MSAGDARGRNDPREAEEPRGRKGGDHRVDGDVAGGAGFEGGEAGRSGERRDEGGGAEQADRLGGRERVGARRQRGQGRGVFRLEGGAVQTMRSSAPCCSAPALTSRSASVDRRGGSHGVGVRVSRSVVSRVMADIVSKKRQITSSPLDCSVLQSLAR